MIGSPRLFAVKEQQPKIFFNKKFINYGQMEEEYWHIILEISKKIEMKNL
ncbi:hypothetical protein Gotur_006235 [Gossypium turneri]